MSETPDTALAITGLACRFPGAPDADAFWKLLLDGREGLTRFTDEELAERGVDLSLRRNQAYVPVGGIIEGQEDFDPDPFGLTEGEAALLDPQQRLFLECSWHALEQAGHACGRDAGAVGVFAGSAHSSYLTSNLAHRYDPTYGSDPSGSLQTAIGTVADYLPLQVAYRLDLRGPAMAIHTTCSTSLVAVHQAGQSLLTEECDTALAGGVSLTVPQGRGYLYVPDGPFSADGRSCPFSAEATGIVFTQGVGVVVLRRLADALNDGDPVLAVMLGSAVNNDGAAKVGFTAPSVGGQARVIAEALATADADPHSIGYVEAHGTGTQLGDPIEVEALRRAFGRADQPWCALGSVKGNIGHANAAAGVAGLIKTVLFLQHGVLPASINADPLNPQLGLESSPFEIVSATRRSLDGDTPRRAGVSAFGIGGTNCHVVLQEPPPRQPSPRDGRSQLILASGCTEAACGQAMDEIARALPKTELADAAYTSQVGRAALEHRAAAVVTAQASTFAAVRSASPVRTPTQVPRVVFAFPGGGAQYAGMGAGLYRDEPVFAATVDECATLFSSLLGGLDVRDVLLANPSDDETDEMVRSARHGLPALFATSLATARLLESWQVRPDLVLGHSLGEYVAAVVAGALCTSDAAALVAVRSQGMAEGVAGAMLSVPLGEQAVRDLLDRVDFNELDLAVVNAPDACVVSGPRDVVALLGEELIGRSVDARLLGIDAPGHSRLVEPIVPALREVAARLSPQPPRIPLVTTLTGALVNGELADPEHWARHLRSTVRFSSALGTALENDAILVQVGPGATLAGLARRHGLNTLRGALTTLPHPEEARSGGGADDRATLLDAVGQLWAHGVDVDFGALHPPGRRRIATPVYPFQRRRLWIDPPPRSARCDGPVPDVDEPLQVPVWRQLPPQTSTPNALLGQSWLVVGPQGSLRERICAALVDAGAKSTAVMGGPSWTDVDGSFTGLVSLIGAEAGDDPAEHVAEAVLGYASLARFLARLGDGDRPDRLLQVTCGGERVENADEVDPAVAAVAALPRVLAQEVPGLRWRELDLPAMSVDASGVAVEAAELGPANGSAPVRPGARIAVRGSTRWLRELVSWRPVGVGDRSEAPVVLITGGLGDVGLTMAEHLAATHGAQVVITSRTGLPGPAGVAPGAPANARLAAVERMRADGLQVQVCRVDASDALATADLLDQLIAAHGRLDIVIHAAGVVGSGGVNPLVATYADDVSGHVASKVIGALVLRDAIAALPPDQRPHTVLLMSSATTVVGGLGLGAYAAANGFLDGLAAGRAHRNGEPRWLSVAWDGWRVTTSSDQPTRTMVMWHSLGATDGMRSLDRLLVANRSAGAPPVVAVSPSDLGARVADPPEATAAPPTNDAQAADAHPRTAGERLVAALWSELLGWPVTDRDADFFALGGHSLLATRMLAQLRDQHGVEVGLRDLLARPTVAKLAELIGPDDAADAPTDVDVAAVPSPSPSPARCAPASASASAHYDPRGPFPLTRVQHAYWVGRTGAYALGGVGCHFYLEFECRELDIDRYESAWNRVIQRHAMLRAVVSAEGQNLVLEEVPRFKIRVHHLAALSQAERDARLLVLREELSHRVARADRWPLLEIRAAQLPAGEVRLLVSVDVLVCDWASYVILDGELRRFYEDPEAELAPLETNFAECVEALHAKRGSAQFERAADYWRRRLPGLAGAPALPVAPDHESPPRFTRRRAELDAPSWRRLQDQAADIGATPTAVLLTAYADLLAAWSGDERFSITLTLFDRPGVHPDVDRVVGDFTTLLLLEVDRRKPAAFAERVRATQQQLFEDLDHREFSALDVIAAQAAHTGQRNNVPVVFTSALGFEQVLGDEHDLEWAGKLGYGVSQTPQVWLDHQVFVQREALHLQWDVLESVLPAAAADIAFAAHVGWIRRLVAEPALWRQPSAGPALTPVAEAGPAESSGSAQDLALRRSLDNEMSAPAAASPPGDRPRSARTALLAIWSELLQLPDDRIEPSTTFLALGGDSLLAVRMATEVRRRLGVALPIADVLTDRSFAELADVIDEAGVSTQVAIEQLDRRADPDAPFPLTPLQQAYWVGQQGAWALSYDTAHMYVDFLLAGVDTEGVQDAVRRLVAHQPMLRCTVLPDGTQQILPVDDPAVTDLPVTMVDLRDADPPTVDAAVRAARERMARRGPTRAPWPFELVVHGLPDGLVRLHAVCSLLIADGWSFQLIFHDLFTFLDDTNATLPPLQVGFDDYVPALERLRETAQWRAQRDWWWQRLGTLAPAPALPLTADLDAVQVETMSRRDTRLPADRWAVLRKRCTEHRLTASAVLAACYAVAVARLAGHRRFALTVLHINRVALHADLSRMVGPFASTALVDIAPPEGALFTAVVRGVQEEIAAVLDHGLVSGVEVARELGRRRDTRLPVAPVVFHSTLGMKSPFLDLPASIDVHEVFQRVRTPQVVLDMQVFEHAGDLVINLDAVAELFGDGALDALFADLESTVNGLVDDPSAWTTTVHLPAAELPPPSEAVHLAGDHAPDAPGPPRGAIEQRIAALWIELLAFRAIDEVDRAASFFLLGGDSLTAVRMLARLRRELGSAIAPQAFLTRPTVAGLARELSGQAEAALEAVADIAVPLRDGLNKHPLFLIHPSGGDVLCYADLASRLTTDHPVIALQDPGLSGGEVLADIPLLARRYVQVLRAHQPHGPYLLGGWSMGGTVAHQMACELRHVGERVALLVMIDANTPERIVAIEGLSEDETDAELWLRYLRSLEAYLDIDLGAGRASALAELAAVPVTARRDEVAHRLREHGLLGPDGDGTALEVRAAVFRSHLRALAGHQAGDLGPNACGEVLLLRAAQSSPRNGHIGMGVDDAFDLPDLGWRRHIAGPLTVEEISAHHYLMLRSPAVGRVAEVISAALTRVDTGAAVTSHSATVPR